MDRTRTVRFHKLNGNVEWQCKECGRDVYHCECGGRGCDDNCRGCGRNNDHCVCDDFDDVYEEDKPRKQIAPPENRTVKRQYIWSWDEIEAEWNKFGGLGVTPEDTPQEINRKFSRSIGEPEDAWNIIETVDIGETKVIKLEASDRGQIAFLVVSPDARTKREAQKLVVGAFPEDSDLF